MKQAYKISKFAFTLAEVLITLAIIGVVAAITIPSVMQSTQNAETIAKVKKAYATFSLAFQKAELDNGPVVDWGWTGADSDTGANNALTILAPYLNLTKKCGTSTGCFPNVSYKFLNNAFDGNIDSSNIYDKNQFNDGTLMAIRVYSADCSSIKGTSLPLSNVCASFRVDVNGSKSPNQWGYDLFLFYITKYGVFPAGMYSLSNCNRAVTSQAGIACASWILEKGNMDYLKE